MQDIPVLSSFDADAWRKFKTAYSAFRMKGGEKKMYELISDELAPIIALLMQLETLVALEDKALVAKLDGLFAPKSAGEALEELRGIKLVDRNIKGLSTYLISFRNKVQEIKPLKVAESAQVRAFIDGLRWSYVKCAVEAKAPATVDVAIALALEAGQSAPLELPRQSTGSSAKQNGFSSAPKAKIDEKSLNAAPTQNSSTPANEKKGGKFKDVECFRCNEKGHYASSCPQRLKRDGSKERPQTSFLVGAAEGPRVRVELPGSIKCFALLDTGSRINIISPDLADRLEAQGACVRPKRTMIRGISGTIHISDKEMTFEVKIENGTDSPLTFTADFVVTVCDPEILLLGYPTMMKVGRTKLFDLIAPEPVLVAQPVDDPMEYQVEYNNQFITDPVFRKKVDELLEKHKEVFSPIDEKGADVLPFEIELVPGAKLVSSPPARLAPVLAKASKEQTERLLQLGQARPSRSQWASRIVMAPKKQPDSWRQCVDYTKLNKLTVDMQFPLQDIKTVLSRCQGKTVFAALDMTSGFNQVRMHEKSIPMTAFVTPDGLFEYTVMPFGLKNAPRYFMKVVMDTLGDLVGRVCEVFIDDILIYGATIEEFLANLDLVLERLWSKHWRLNREKCRIGLSQVEYLGHIINQFGITLSEDRRRALNEMGTPKDVSSLRSFLGFANYFRPFIPNYALISKPLTKLCSNKREFVWGEEQQKAFTAIKEAGVRIPILSHIDYSKKLIVRTDASTAGVGGMLVQVDQDGKEEVVALASKAFNDTETKWSTIEQECFAIFFCIRKWEHMLRGQQFEVETDHKNLEYLDNTDVPKLVRWRLALQEYQFTIRHISGSKNVVADALSRIFAVRAEEVRSVIMRAHNAVIGHHGVVRTEEMLREQGLTWPDMRQDIQQVINSCAICQKVRMGQGPMNPSLHSTMVHQPFESLSIDTIGPLPEDEFGNKYIICAIDDFTRYVELFACKDATAKSAGRVLFQIFCRYGAFKQVRSDRGTQLTATSIEEFLRLVKVDHMLALAHHPESMGIVERTNAEVMRHLRVLVFDVLSRMKWSEYLPLAQRIINAAIHSAIGVAPTTLLFAGAVDSSRQLIKTTQAEPVQKTYLQYLEDLIATQENLIKASDVFQQKHIDARIAKSPQNPTEFAVGDLVLASYPDRAPDKLTPRWQGPFLVKKVEGNRYSCKDLRDRKIRQFDISRLKKYVEDPQRDNVQVAGVDHQEYIVEAILSHRGPVKKKSKMEFLVRWAGYSEEENSWEPYAAVKDLAALDAYLAEHPELGL